MAGPDAPTSAKGGRPRSEQARLSVLEAAADLLEEGGLRRATVESIADRAGVSKVTIYKWWPNRGAVAIDAYFHRYDRTYEFVDTGTVEEDLTDQIRVLVDAFRGHAGDIMAELIGSAQSDPALAETLRVVWLDPRRSVSRSVLERAMERGQIRGDIEVQTVLDQLYGPVYYRLLMQHQPLADDLPRRLVQTVLDGIRTR